MDTEDLYISLYEGFSPTAEYLQGDSRNRNLLPEAAILAGLAFALEAFAQSFFGKMGEAAAESTIDAVKAKLKKSEGDVDRKAMLDALELMGPYLKHLADMSDGQRDVYQSAVASALGGRGYPPDVAERTAGKVMASLVTAGAR
jgi:hypothetical protein